jgi:hypothetical protein
MVETAIATNEPKDKTFIVNDFYLLLSDIVASNDDFKGLDRALDLLERFEEEYGKNADRSNR